MELKQQVAAGTGLSEWLSTRLAYSTVVKHKLLETVNNYQIEIHNE